jgi:hypothetical protein
LHSGFIPPIRRELKFVAARKIEIEIFHLAAST